VTDPAHAFVGERNDGLRFRPLTEADLPFVFALYASVRAAELAPVPWPEAAKEAFLADQAALQHRHYLAHYADADMLVIEEAGKSIGRIYVHRVPGEIRLMEIALVPERRNAGIGTALLRELVDEATRTRCKVTLHVEPNNPAQHLYARVGFELVERGGVYDLLALRPRTEVA
jgi:ribosomal protein S18 acetylase RimI-like enzyme